MEDRIIVDLGDLAAGDKRLSAAPGAVLIASAAVVACSSLGRVTENPQCNHCFTAHIAQPGLRQRTRVRITEAISSLPKMMLLIGTVVDDSHSLCWVFSDSLKITLTFMPGVQHDRLVNLQCQGSCLVSCTLCSAVKRRLH